jgi:hypothetical protein
VKKNRRHIKAKQNSKPRIKEIDSITTKGQLLEHQESRPKLKPTPMHRHMMTAIKWLFRAALGLLAVLGSVYGIWGPPWPVEPTVSPGLPSLGSPFDVPFNVSNKSLLFTIDGLSLSCKLKLVQTNGLIIPNGIVRLRGEYTIGPGQSRPYVCPFSRAYGGPYAENIKTAQITISSEYKSPWPVISKKLSVDSDVFTLNSKTIPPQWMTGSPM